MFSAGSTKLTELHGCARQVVCMSCHQEYSRYIYICFNINFIEIRIFRAAIQKTLLELNPNWKVDHIGELAPDGDIEVEISDNALANFQPPFCDECGERSILKTDVVFFGDNVPRNVFDQCYEKASLFLIYIEVRL